MKKITLFASFFLLCKLVDAQECGTPGSPNKIFPISKTVSPSSDPICVNVALHIVRNSNGSNGFNPAQITDLMTNLNDAFLPHNISINKVGTDFINDSDYFDLVMSSSTQNDFYDLIQAYDVPNAIDFYIVNTITNPGASGTIVGLAEEILGLNLVVRKSHALKATSAHEIGHCLNLYHTHHGTYQENGDPNQCPETANNGGVCGDYVSDTPPDPRLIGGPFGNFNESSCVYTGNATYAPDVRNFMSYGRDCREYFSNGQGQRMRLALLNSGVLQTVVCGNETEILGEEVLCHGETISYSIVNSIGPFTWSASSVLSINYSLKNNDEISVYVNDPNYHGPAQITVSYNGGTIVKDIWIGAPSAPSVDGPTTVAPSHVAEYNVLNHISGSSYVWDYPTGWDNNPNIDGPWSWGKPNGVDDDGTIIITASNRCGASSPAMISVNVETDGDGVPKTGGTTIYSVYPNPANSLIHFRKLEDDNPTIINSIKLYNKLGILKAYNSDIETMELDISMLKAGIYFLQISSSEGLEYHQIVIR